MVDKVENTKPEDEPRMTFDYSRVTKLLPGSHLELSSKVHDHPSNPHHSCLFSADLKHAYLTVPLHPEDRHYFTFKISGIGQIQPTRLQQGSQSTRFTMTELSYRAFGPIPAPHPEPSLFDSPDSAIPPSLVFYMNDFLGGFQDFGNIFPFSRDHFFPRVEWARLLLSSKKLRLFASLIKALGVTLSSYTTFPAQCGPALLRKYRINTLAISTTTAEQTERELDPMWSGSLRGYFYTVVNDECHILKFETTDVSTAVSRLQATDHIMTEDLFHLPGLVWYS